MLIKLNYNTQKTPAQTWRVVSDIINNPSINSIANLRSRETSASYAADLLTGLVDSTSYIIRTNDITPNTYSHIARPPIATSSNTPFEFVLSQKVYDAQSYVFNSASFDGTGDYLSIDPRSTGAFDFGTGQFTIEGWIYLSGGSSGTLFDNRTGSTSLHPVIYFLNANQIQLYVAGAGPIVSSSFNFTGNWVHVALVRITTVTHLYVNGVQQSSGYNDSNNYAASGPVLIGGGFGGSNQLNGYIANLRVVKGVGVYSGNFQPPPLTSPLITIQPAGGGTTNTNPITSGQCILLTCQQPTFSDSSSANSGSAFAVTPVGNAVIYPFSLSATLNSRYYISLSTTGTLQGNANSQISNTIVGDMASTQWPITAATLQTTAQGTLINLRTTGNASSSNAQTMMFSSSINSGISTLWVYLTDTSFAWAANRDVTYNVYGLPAYATNNYRPDIWNGPHIYSQYIRNDILNSQVNSIIPLVFNNHSGYNIYQQQKGPGEGLFSREDEVFCTQVPTTNERDPGLSTNPTYQNLSLQMLNCFGNLPGNAPSFSNAVNRTNNWRNYYVAPYTAIGLGGTKWSDEGGFCGYSYSAATVTTQAAGSLLAISQTAAAAAPIRGGYTAPANWFLPSISQIGSRWISSDLQSYYGYALLPMYHRWVSGGVSGGNITDLSGLYVFNGDYYPGDEVVVDGTTYMLLPFTMGRPNGPNIANWLYSSGPDSRLALAVPKL